MCCFWFHVVCAVVIITIQKMWLHQTKCVVRPTNFLSNMIGSPICKANLDLFSKIAIFYQSSYTLSLCIWWLYVFRALTRIKMEPKDPRGKRCHHAFMTSFGARVRTGGPWYWGPACTVARPVMIPSHDVNHDNSTHLWGIKTWLKPNWLENDNYYLKWKKMS